MVNTEAVSQEQLRKYAELLVKKGAHVQEGQKIYLTAPIEAAPFAHLVVEEAYKAGSGAVTVVYDDDVLTKLTYMNNPLEYFDTVAEWQAERANSLAREGAAFIFLEGSDPNALKGVDPKKPALARKRRNEAYKDYRERIDFGHNQWLIAGVSTPKWAEMVFPELKGEDAVNALWHAILLTARADGDNPIAAWDEHKKNFDEHKEFLNSHKFVKLHYTNEKGTDLYVGLPEKHLWEGGGAETVGGVYFFPNMPTEEVYTSPHRAKTEGIVYSALPLVYSGNVIKDFWFKFESGKVVDFGAQKGAEVLEQLLATDDGAKHLGECALVPKESPIRQSGKLFFSTLYDENASCHLAVGMGFPDAYDGGLQMSKEELLSEGVNDSATHVDFMIGSDDLNIVGIKADGTAVQIFKSGTWAY